jgi:hypothetical protein
MTGNLDSALRTLLVEALPGLFGGASPPVSVSATLETFDVDPESADATAGEPRPDDRLDELPFDANQPAGPYTLSQPPYPGARRVWLVSGESQRFALRDEEIAWDKIDSRVFRLDLRRTRVLDGITTVRVLYAVTAVFTKLKAAQTVSVRLQSSNAARLSEAEALTIAVIQLNRQRLIDEARAFYENGDYSAAVEIKSLKLVKGAQLTENGASPVRLLTLHVNYELKAIRALAEDEGMPIQRILSPGRAPTPKHPIDIDVQVDV